MDLTTQYLGMKLKNPLVASASPLSENLNSIRKLEDAGVSAIVLHSLFEEQLALETLDLHHHLTHGTESYAESLTYFPEPVRFYGGPDEYLEHIEKAKKACAIPIIASLNGYTAGGWTKYAKHIEQVGADALELNIYHIPTQFDQSGEAIEQSYIDVLQSVKKQISIPVAVKLSPFFSNMAYMARRLDEAGADALVLFNRFYQPDIDLENLDVRPNVILSTPHAMRLPLRWIAILYGHLKCNLAATSGIHTDEDVIKMLMVGANVTMLCSTLLKNGVDEARRIQDGIVEWMEENEYESVAQMQGSMSQKSCANPEAFERANYMKTLQSYQPRS